MTRNRLLPALSMVLVGVALLHALPVRIVIANSPEATLPGLAKNVDVYFDVHGVPHVYAESRPDAARALGYVHARDRLWQMDIYRRQATGTLAEVLGKDSLESDVLMRQLGIRRGCEELWNSTLVPQSMREEILAYTAGVNARIDQLAEEELPLPFKFLGYEPESWTPVDCLVFTKYMGWDQSGTRDDLWFGTMVDKLGTAAVEELWPLERPYEVPTVKRQFDRTRLPESALKLLPGTEAAYAATFARLKAASPEVHGISFGSNNWAVDGTKTASGKPILCNDPHLGFSLPSIWYTAHLSVAGKNVAGVTFPGTPFVIIGHNDHVGWGFTNMQADAVDYYVETINPDDPNQYLHRDEWKPLERITERIPVKGQEPHTLHIDSTVHGPVVNRDGRAITLSWTGLGMTTDAVALWKMGRAENLKDFLGAMDDLDVPAMNVVYADVHGTIAICPYGRLPIRMRGAGRVPLDGASGDDDWQGWIPRDQLPLAVNPAEHFVASANGRPVPLGFPHYVGWMWDPSYRTRRIHDMLSAAGDLTIEKMQTLQYDAHDKAAERFLPCMLASLTAEDLNSAEAREVAAILADWDYVAAPESAAPILWLRWFHIYRDQVWDDEWASRDIEKPGGSWGFTGNNRREPMLEVLEYMTREQPRSIWFDDQGTEERESRDDIVRRSFQMLLASIRDQYGEDPERWAWKNINVLKISSLTGQPALAREGGPVPGTCFTVNPGSRGGHVGGGASWRMIVDFADVSTSVGVYPGGQSEDPASPLYDDQIKLWAAGEYLPLDMIGNPAVLPKRAKYETLTLVPEAKP